ncbi:hypothetical protein PVAG01_00897 [Phlyctema vagabunda]|uniref:Uncharacterized protein n=1 Tax=Phlyctema vagabunda TaxID=108571 RepID=A0ABR4PW10_9HELO
MRLIPTYSEGFEGDEAKPIGKLVRLKQNCRLQSRGSGTIRRVGELKLVSGFIEELPIHSSATSASDIQIDINDAYKKDLALRSSSIHDSVAESNIGIPIDDVELPDGPVGLHTCNHKISAIELDAKSMSLETEASSVLESSVPRKPLLASQQDRPCRLKRTVSFSDSVDVSTQFMMISMPRSGSTYDTADSDTDSDTDQNSTDDCTDDNSTEPEQQNSPDDNRVTTYNDSMTTSRTNSGKSIGNHIAKLSRKRQTISFHTRLSVADSSDEVELVTLQNTLLNKCSKSAIGTGNNNRGIVGQPSGQVDRGLRNKDTSQKVQTNASKTREWIKTTEHSALAFEEHQLSEFQEACFDRDRSKAVLRCNKSTGTLPMSQMAPLQGTRKASQLPNPEDEVSLTDWRPHQPALSDVLIEVEEDIFDRTPTKPSFENLETLNRFQNMKRSSGQKASLPPSLRREEAFISPRNSLSIVVPKSMQILPPQVPESQMSYQYLGSEASSQDYDSSSASEGGCSQVSSEEVYHNVHKSMTSIRRHSAPLYDRQSLSYSPTASLHQSQLHSQLRRSQLASGSVSKASMMGITKPSTTPTSGNVRAKSLPLVPPFMITQG